MYIHDTSRDFKLYLSLSQALYVAGAVIPQCQALLGCTANLCAIDLSKAFDKVNHHALYVKLMKRNIPVQLLEIA